MPPSLPCLTTSTKGPRFIDAEEIVAIAQTAQRWDKLADLAGVTIYQLTDADGRAFRLTRNGTDGTAILEPLPIVLADPHAWA